MGNDADKMTDCFIESELFEDVGMQVVRNAADLSDTFIEQLLAFFIKLFVAFIHAGGLDALEMKFGGGKNSAYFVVKRFGYAVPFGFFTANSCFNELVLLLLPDGLHVFLVLELF